MQDGLRQLTRVRASCARTPATTHTTEHCFYMRLLGHAAWKDLSVLLCVEESRLLVCLLCSSRVTQKHLTSVCAESGVVLEWLGGAALMVEPAALARTEVNPVWAAFDAVLQLPLLSETSTAGGRTVGGGAAERADGVSGVLFTEDSNADSSSASDSVGACVHDALNALHGASLPLRGFSLVLVSSLPFRGARRCCPVGRFTEEASAHAATAGTAVTAAADPCHPVARRYVWRLLPSHSWVLPHLLTRLVQSLIEQCDLCAFTLHCGVPSLDAAPRTATNPVGAEWTGGTAGVRLVRGAPPASVTLRRGPSTVSWVAFSRLSGGAWVGADAREGLALDDGAAEAVELEFELHTIRYGRCAAAATAAASAGSALAFPLRTGRRPREALACDAAVGAEDARSGGCVHPETWGASFEFGVSVKRVIVVDEGEGD
ncbi:hypothetical protein ABB37_10136 [Leptomonas pyrrhocoris]|uniref:Uncharacterized protein n=1 Tax=Leptomonas pyrrhocoris TaxID=157538 RepID=A0A0M9FP10_LEPPY|nr:hypothetical protein ABB37_10136 [Leptomonas pyrrhocoris]KPA73077.1 hypothetical protein ABB37_10136 [Leptomonas pyrrhocoris]|eukprot:XP_015651516.1 hypothetical protein ABB37_10136 [Leptomonas pyrrhocoris]